eukprot:TRINITY_DN4290_c0_g2_i1.p1 TRINITY_DN4290_c0_g2~~TRINITY_DN4290_c0_g2_i1.p1  ORF type:complete len:1213 (-),score=271.96 TRINITY_DN4290_c0_g2_i1:21-3659(-)
MFWFQYLYGGISWTVTIVMRTIIPILTSNIIIFVGTVYENGESPSMKIGLCYVIGIAVANILSTLSEQHYFFWSSRIAEWLVTTTRMAVYRKSMNVSNISKGTGQNLMNIDPGSIGNVSWQLHRLWIIPTEIIICVALLYHWLGPAAFASIVTFSFILPVSYFMMRTFHSENVVLMNFKDERIKKITEILQGITIVKMFCWEDKMVDQVEVTRKKEVKSLKKIRYCQALFNFLLFLNNSLLSIACFGTYVYLGNNLTAEVIFPCIVVFRWVTWPVLLMPEIASSLSQAFVSLKRVNKFLRKEEIIKNIGNDSEYAVVFDNVTSSYFENEMEDKGANEDSEESNAISYVDESFESKIVLEHIKLSIKEGELIAIIGRVGSGKSSLIKSILGEMKINEGNVYVNGSYAFSDQISWIRNQTIRENILNGKEYDEDLYQEVIEVSQLEADLDMFPAGDFTEIGEKGINISGGQKQRVSIARSIYSESDIYLFDDPLSAVDAHVGKSIFDECILSYLNGKTRILVTHQLQYLQKVDRIIILENGKIQQEGTFTEILENGFDFAEMVKQMTNNEEDSETFDKSLDNLKVSLEIKEKQLKDEEEKKKLGKLIEDEERSTGKVDSSLYLKYFKRIGGILVWSILIAASISGQFFTSFSFIWLGIWSDDDSLRNCTATNSSMRSNSTCIEKNEAESMHYLEIYILISMISALFGAVSNFFWAKTSLDCGIKMHSEQVFSVLRSPMRYFYSTPTGRIVNRFSKDQQSADRDIPQSLIDLVMCIMSVLATIVVISVNSPWFIIPVIPICAVYYFVSQYFSETAREIGRLVSISFSPIFSYYSESIEGLNTIRAYNQEERFVSGIENRIDENERTIFSRTGSFRWLGLRIYALGAVCVLSVNCIAIFSRGNLSPGVAGLIISLAQGITGELNWFTRCSALLESQINSIERIIRLIENENEAELEIAHTEPSHDWPSEGNIDFIRVCMKYKEDQENYVLDDVSFSVSGREKIGVVGRTGAGKSTLINVLFRLTELSSGSIIIDGIDISTIGLRDLRKKIGIIPQDPMLFSGTIRSNLDPFDEYSDNNIWSVLRRVHLSTYVESQYEKLETPISDNGDNLSVGQKQLLCIGRALLRENSILVLDEATASVDNETDGLIQQTIRTEFQNKTVLTIAHRLNTIMDSDKILVMDEGQVREFDSPMNLLEDANGLFKSLVDEAEYQGVNM